MKQRSDWLSRDRRGFDRVLHRRASIMGGTPSLLLAVPDRLLGTPRKSCSDLSKAAVCVGRPLARRRELGRCLARERPGGLAELPACVPSLASSQLIFNYCVQMNCEESLGSSCVEIASEGAAGALIVIR